MYGRNNGRLQSTSVEGAAAIQKKKQILKFGSLLTSKDIFSILRIQVWYFIGGRGHREQDQVCSPADPSNSSTLLSLSSSLTYQALVPSSSRLMCQSQGSDG